MKKKYYVYLGLVIVLILIWLIWHRFASSYAVVQVTTPEASRVPAAPAISDNGVTPEDMAQTPWKGTDAEKQRIISDIRDSMQKANQPIKFYGLVLDQDNVPLPKVKVRLNVKHTQEILPGATRDVMEYLDLITDEQGRFAITDKKGALLAVDTLEKTGYEAPYVGNRAFWYFAPVPNLKYYPDQAKPEIFRMWKLQGAEKLLDAGIGTRIPYDGSTVYFDLQKSRQVPAGGDIKVTLLRTPLQIKRGQEKYDWTATIEAIDGGLIVSSDEFMYQAPETGYKSSLTISVSAKDAKWSSDQHVFFYLKSRGMYARVQAEFMTDSDKPMTGFEVSAYINPSGSRNLEYDPLNRATAP
jgi:hypothetical protein